MILGISGYYSFGKSHMDTQSIFTGSTKSIRYALNFFSVASFHFCFPLKKYFRRRREGNKDVESSCQGPASTAVNSIGVYTIAGPINEGPTSDEKTNRRKNNYDNVAIVDNSVMYAVPVKIKKTTEGERKIQKDDGSLKVNGITENKENGVIMSENELYEPCPNIDHSVDENSNYLVKYENVKSNDKINNEEETGDDSQIMYENNELYSSSVDLAEDGTELHPDVTYENFPNDINHSSDWYVWPINLKSVQYLTDSGLIIRILQLRIDLIMKN